MQRTILGAIGVVFLLGWSGPAWGALCPKCRDLMFVDSPGKCSECGAATSSGALKLCPKCSAARHKCEHCLAPVDVVDAPAATPQAENPATEKPTTEKPATEKPPAELPPGAGVPIEKLPEAKPPAAPPGQPAPTAPVPIDLKKSGGYIWGKWQYRLDIKEPGTRGEGRWGWLWYDGQKLPRGQVNDYYRTPWGPIYWVDVPRTPWGAHGWMPAPLAQNRRQGLPLTVPASLLAGVKPKPPLSPGASEASQPPATPKPARPGSLELTRAENGKRARVWIGNVIVVRLPGNPTTGYQWQFLPSPNSVVRLMGQPQFTSLPRSAGMVGAGGTVVFTFQVIQPGSGAIRLVYARPWEKNNPPAETFAVGLDAFANPQPGLRRPNGVPPPTDGDGPPRNVDGGNR